MLKSLSIACVSTLSLLGASFAQAADLTGTWRSIDDKTGFSKWVRMSFLANAAVTPLIAIVYFY
ncbi:MAG: hypothetical protein EOO68_12030, partial [Moraxellaceae bacterium]